MMSDVDQVIRLIPGCKKNGLLGFNQLPSFCRNMKLFHIPADSRKAFVPLFHITLHEVLLGFTQEMFPIFMFPVAIFIFFLLKRKAI